jgi:mannose-6-phosphate isomerase-like protein (cupin superfamily)
MGAVVKAFAACHEPAAVQVPPVTTAMPAPSQEPQAMPGAVSADAGAPASPPRPEPKLSEAAFVEGAKKLTPDPCSRLYLAVAKGTANVGSDTLAVNDILVVTYPQPVEVKATGLAVSVILPLECPGAGAKPVKTIIRAKEAPEVAWAKGAMKAHLDVGPKVSPELYLGRLEGTEAAKEHVHATSAEKIIAIEAAGTFTIDGVDHRLGPKQIMTVPRNTKHAYKPDPSSKLVAWQIYEPPGPEQRFLALAAAEKDGGAPTAPDAGKR